MDNPTIKIFHSSDFFPSPYTHYQHHFWEFAKSGYCLIKAKCELHLINWPPPRIQIQTSIVKRIVYPNGVVGESFSKSSIVPLPVFPTRSERSFWELLMQLSWDSFGSEIPPYSKVVEVTEHYLTQRSMNKTINSRDVSHETETPHVTTIQSNSGVLYSKRIRHGRKSCPLSCAWSRRGFLYSFQ